MQSTICLAVVAGLFAAGSPAAQAENIVPNPSFEMGCTAPVVAGDVPDSWSPGTGGTIECSTTARTGTFGMRVHGTQNVGTAATTGCISRSLSGSYAASFSSSVTTGANVGSRRFNAQFYSDSNCQTFQQAAFLQDDSPHSPTGAYTTDSGNMTAPAGTNSVFFFLSVQCADTAGNVCSPDTTDVVYDDLSFEVPATAVTFRSLSAARTGKGVAVHWRTASELGTLGFNVYREVNGKRVRVNARLIAARGGSYSFLDRWAPRDKAVRYWLQAVDLDGSRAWHGPALLPRR